MALKTLRSEISGTIWKIEVTQGSQVAQGDTLIVIESMKMEHRIYAPRDGEIGAINVKVGDTVKAGERVVFLKESLK